MLDPLDELERLLGKTTKDFALALLQIGDAMARKAGVGAERAVEILAELLTRKMAGADMLGRRRALLEADEARGGRNKTSGTGPSSVEVPMVVFDEAVWDMVTRRPELARNAAEVARVYQRHGFAAARAAEIEVSQRVQRAIQKGMVEGWGVDKGEKTLEEIADWSRAYAETVYRTNCTSAYTAGRFRQAESGDVNDVIGAIEFNAVGDANTRPNHKAADGTIAPPGDAIWSRISPPLGYNCRCGIRLVSRFELLRRGLLRDGMVLRSVPASINRAGPDPGFIAIRPDRRIYAA
jgi:SPP1 gp7 family putative phage head morphogenesis protein